MRITYEKDAGISLLYLYLREFDGNMVETLTGIRANLLFDHKMNWSGIEVYNYIADKTTLLLPLLKSPYIPGGNEMVSLTDEKYRILFDASSEITRKMEAECNIDYNEQGGLQGIELIINHFPGSMKIADTFIRNDLQHQI